MKIKTFLLIVFFFNLSMSSDGVTHTKNGITIDVDTITYEDHTYFYVAKFNNDRTVMCRNFGNGDGIFMYNLLYLGLEMRSLNLVRISNNGKIFISLDASENYSLVRVIICLTSDGILDETLNSNSNHPGIVITQKN